MITRKPTRRPTLDELAAKGEREPSREQKLGMLKINLRLPIPIVDRIDGSVKRRRRRGPAFFRHDWLVEAVFEKLDRECGRAGRGSETLGPGPTPPE
jgi:hypothetical protein